MIRTHKPEIIKIKNNIKTVRFNHKNERKLIHQIYAYKDKYNLTIINIGYVDAVLNQSPEILAYVDFKRGVPNWLNSPSENAQ